MPRWFRLNAEEASDGVQALKGAAAQEGDTTPIPRALVLQGGEGAPLGGWPTLMALGTDSVWLLYPGEDAWEYDRASRRSITRVDVSNDGLGMTIEVGDRTLEFVNFAIPDWLWEIADELDSASR